MTQPVVFVALYLLGLSFHLGFGPRRQPALCCALGFVTGLALWVLCAGIALELPVPYDATTAKAAYLIPFTVCSAVTAVRWRPTPRQVAIVVAWTLASAVFYIWLASFDSSRFSADSRHIVSAGLKLPSEKSFRYLSSKGAFQLLAHSIAKFTPDDYLYALSSATGLALAPLFIVVGWRGLDRLGGRGAAPRALVVVTAVATVTAYNYLWHLVYIHNNLASAVYVFAFAAMFWLAELEQDTAYLPGAVLFLIAYGLQRVEAPVFALPLAVIAIFPSKLPRRALTIAFAVFCGWFAIWYGEVVATGSERLSEERADLIALGMIAAFVTWIVASRTRWIVHARHLPRAFAAALVLLLVYGYFARHAALSKSVDALHHNLLWPRDHMWGYTWHALLGLTALSLTSPAVPSGRILSYAALLGFLMILAFGLQHPYRHGVTDSANRMVIQVVPLAMFYFAMQFAPLAGRFTPTSRRATNGDRDDERARSTEGTAGAVPGAVDPGDGAPRPDPDAQQP